jgi:hypothetical protein
VSSGLIEVAVRVTVWGRPRIATLDKVAVHRTLTRTCPPGRNAAKSVVVVICRQTTPPWPRVSAAICWARVVAWAGPAAKEVARAAPAAASSTSWRAWL